jgi:adenosylmethionine-8-amino-7-oxononanoate aminotransferase
MSLSERDSRVIWHPFTQAKTAESPMGIVRAEACWLFAEDGTRYLDGTASWWVNAHGHAHPYIAAQIADQASKLEHIIFAGFTHEPAVSLAEKLVERMPGNQQRIFYSDNGSTSVEVALKMAIQYFHNKGELRNKIIAFKNGYHGDTFGSMSVGSRNAFNAPFNSLLFDTYYIDPPETGKEQESLEQLEAVLKDEQIAAFIFEPLVQGANGMRMHKADVLSKLIKRCRESNVLTIADEVFTGFYRTGKLFASGHLSEQADLICLSKTITGGTLPLGVTAAPEFIYDAFLSADKLKTFFHGHSFTANPLACRAALASLELLEKPECLENIAAIGEQHIAFSKQIENHHSVFEVRCIGTILAVELKTKEERGYLNSISERLTRFFLERGIYLRPLGNVIYCTPPYSIDTEQLKLIYNAILELLEFEAQPEM